MATVIETPSEEPTAAKATAPPVTLAQFEELVDPADAQLELDGGEVVEVTRPKFRHGRICSKVDRLIGRWLDSGPGGEVATNDAGVITSREPDSLRGPDVFYIREERMPSDEEDLNWLTKLPDLCVEVRSPSEAWPACVRKAVEYLEAGCPEVWIVEPDRREVHLFTAEGTQIFGESDTLVSETLSGLEVPVAELFRRGRIGG